MKRMMIVLCASLSFMMSSTMLWAEPGTNEKIALPPELSYPVAGAAAAVVHGKLFIVGGKVDPMTGTQFTWLLNTMDGEWERKASMPVLHPIPEVMVSEGKIIVGSKMWRFSSLYNPISNTWQRLDLNFTADDAPGARQKEDFSWARVSAHYEGEIFARLTRETTIDGKFSRTRLDDDSTSSFVFGGVAVAIGGGKIYFVGDEHPGDGVLVFDTLSRRWGELPAMHVPRTDAAAAIHNGKLYVIGGSDRFGRALSYGEAYDPASKTWTTIPPLPTPRSKAAIGSASGKLYVIGGVDSEEKILKVVEAFEPLTGQWTSSGGSHAQERRASVSVEAPRPSSVYPDDPEVPARKILRKDDVAIVVGLEEYERLPKANFGDRDATSFSSALNKLGVPEENVVTLLGKNASMTNVVKYLEGWLPRHVKRDARVWFFFSGHGSPDVNTGTPYIMFWDSDAEYVKNTGLPLEHLYDLLGNLAVKEAVVVLDSCFSGGGTRSILPSGVRPLTPVTLPSRIPPRVIVLAAAAGEQTAGSLDERGHGIFTYHLLEGLHEDADMKSRHLKLRSLFEFARRRTVIDARKQNHEQTPAISGSGDFDLY